MKKNKKTEYLLKWDYEIDDIIKLLTLGCKNGTKK